MRRNSRLGGGTHGGEIIHIRVVVLGRRLGGLRLILRHTVEEDNAVAQMNAIARSADNPLHKKYVFAIGFLGWLVKDNNISRCTSR